MVTQFASMMLGVVDTLMVGHVDVPTLAAASLGHVWTFGTMVFAMGVVFGIDPVVTQAHGAGDARRQGLAEAAQPAELVHRLGAVGPHISNQVSAVIKTLLNH